MYRKITLDNGIRVVSEEIPFVHSVALGVWVRAGSRNETEENHGVSHFIEHLLFKGTEKRSAREIAEALESVGGVLNAFTTKEYTCFYTRVLAEHLDLAIDVLSDMLFNPRFNLEDIEKEKKVILEEIKMYEDSPDELVHDLFAQTVWPGHPLGRAILGTFQSIEGLNRERICNYYHEHYNARNIVLAAAGNFKTQELEEKLAKAFGQRELPGEPAVYYPPHDRPGISINIKDTEQVQICLGTPGLAQDDEDIYALQALNNILGGGISSRLFQLIREDNALAYSVYSYHAGYVDSGLFTVYAGTSPSNFRQVVELILKQLAILKNEGVTEKELKRTKDQIRGNLLLNQENVSHRMSRLGKTELSFGRVITTEEVIENLTKVTVEDVQRVAKNLFSAQSLSLTTLGPPLEELDLKMLARQVGL
ncbi:Predicted Zn-dependent peptidase [Thermanaeromonas toyohensis ToBE]|uniref:Predicted Zn-dependent peptidase n=1 Tax=Thermanaeromonas toyohensis ToBE TaxID=698762 RepID=A0A1W1VQH8_9FIRM|nr:pitrilysin family protein [Thermanaeromonas toyohensis]SMB95596.1 Predicted Zn-dependent peptidase [Thermanaeromonas toyohensis ToBE]